MHAKIEKIALESGIALGNNVAEGSRRDLLNKFALSIVRECADIALREDHDPYECILKEFGVGAMNTRMKELMIQAMVDVGREGDVQKTYQRFGELMVLLLYTQMLRIQVSVTMVDELRLTEFLIPNG